MAFDGIITRAMVTELGQKLSQSKIDKVHQPGREELVLTLHTNTGNLKLYANAGSSDPRIHLTEENLPNPATPPPFCMLLRKHLVGARVQSIRQVGSDRIIEIELEALSELGFTLSKKLVIEIMGKHSNIILVDMESNKVIDSIKRVSIDASRVRQILPGVEYTYPPAQDKIPFDEIIKYDSMDQVEGLDFDVTGHDAPELGRFYLSKIGGISSQIAEELASQQDPLAFIKDLVQRAGSGDYTPHIYIDNAQGSSPVDFHIARISAFESVYDSMEFADLGECMDYYYKHRASSNRVRQKTQDLERVVKNLLDKNSLKLQRLQEDLLDAQNSDNYRLYGELLTANLHLIAPGAKSVTVKSYYDDTDVEIPLDPRYSPSKNAQDYFKKYGKAKTAVKEKSLQIDETQKDITYLESVLNHLEQLDSPQDADIIKTELIEEGYIRRKPGKNRPVRFKAEPHKYISPSGFEILVGRNNKENDELTLRLADKTDIWLHTKDIPGSHVIIRTRGQDPSAEDIYCAASIAAWHSKAQNSGQVPVDYVKVRHVKKPAGAKPGMVIFTDNRTVYVDPKLP